MRTSSGKRKASSEAVQGGPSTKRRRQQKSSVSPRAPSPIAEEVSGETNTATPDSAAERGEVSAGGTSSESSERHAPIPENVPSPVHATTPATPGIPEGEPSGGLTVTNQGEEVPTDSAQADELPGHPNHRCHYAEIPARLLRVGCDEGSASVHIDLGTQLAIDHIDQDYSGESFFRIAFQKLGEAAQMFESGRYRRNLEGQTSEGALNERITTLRGQRDRLYKDHETSTAIIKSYAASDKLKDEKIAELEGAADDASIAIAELKRVTERLEQADKDIAALKELSELNAAAGYETFRVQAQRIAPEVEWGTVVFDEGVYGEKVNQMIDGLPDK